MSNDAPRERLDSLDVEKSASVEASPAPLRSGARAADPAVLGDRHAAVAREEHAANVLRTRRVLGVSVFAWTSFSLLDVIVVRYLDAGPIEFYLLLRLVGTAALFASWLRLSTKSPPSPAALTAIDMCAYAVPAALLGIMCVRFRGLLSPYSPGTCLVIVARSVSAHHPWRKGLWMGAVPMVSFIAVVLGSAFFSPLVAEQLHDPQAVATFCVWVAYLVGTLVLIVMSNHIMWALRRQIFEARSIGKYRLKRRVGTGAMGDVWRAYHASLRRDVAIKILRVDAASQGFALSRFEREVRATSELVHPNTVRVFDYGTTEDGLWYYAMELLEGQDCAALVAREGPLPPERAVYLARQAARALAEAHARGIVHRDVKPENLFVTSLGGEHDFVKVLDFGIAKVTQGDADATLTHAGSVVGTPAYMSPEACAGKEVDPRADVYSLGAVLYWMVSGRPPFEETNVGQLLLAQMATEPESPSKKLGRPLPADFEAVVLRCLRKNPDERCANASELDQELAACASCAGWQPTGATSAPSAEKQHDPKADTMVA